MSDDAPASTPAPVPNRPGELRVALDQLPACHGVVAQALGEAGLSGQELHVVFATGLRATCVGCGMVLTGEELGRLTVTEGDANAALPPKLERLRLGFCPRSGCEARFYQLHLESLPRGNAANVLAHAGKLLRGEKSRLPNLAGQLPVTRRHMGRLALIAALTLLGCFVAYRLIFYRSQLIPFVQPKSPFQVDPRSVDQPPVRR